jgi:copper chaperone
MGSTSGADSSQPHRHRQETGPGRQRPSAASLHRRACAARSRHPARRGAGGPPSAHRRGTNDAGGLGGQVDGGVLHAGHLLQARSTRHTGRAGHAANADVDHCEMAVKRAIKQLDPQAEVAIDRTQNRVQVESVQPREALAHAIAEEGYAVAA